ncbi:MAG TPA: GNAT family N-acetyltransferase [Solirubrobacterales bacterium]|jgi:ribosomal-protein-alanine N-acetyltransferase|nr:GNAT family N-acetyltransferase [Solirubrobacterales bacterium]
MGSDALNTSRLTLRRWREADREPFAAINADPEVMALFPAPLTRSESDRLADSIEAHFERHGFGLWALEVGASGDFVGFAGLAVPSFEAPFTPAVEVGWRLARPAWGRGYATEAARAALAHGFDGLGLEEVVSFTSVGNTRSRAVMERLGMSHDSADDFEHPKIAAGDPLRPHVLYRIRAR